MAMWCEHECCPESFWFSVEAAEAQKKRGENPTYCLIDHRRIYQYAHFPKDQPMPDVKTARWVGRGKRCNKNGGEE